MKFIKNTFKAIGFISAIITGSVETVTPMVLVPMVVCIISFGLAKVVEVFE